MNNERDIMFSRRALKLAEYGVGLVSPNPLVGCVIVDSHGEVVGEGSYSYEGVSHAEQIALQQAGDYARGGTAYVSLEPHDHQGRTRPCTEALIEAEIARVVCPIEDPNPFVSGRGFERLRNAGIEVVTGILADEASRQNEKFICWHKQQRPFVHLKLATSLDGRISLDNTISTALSADAGRKVVQQIRHEHDAILVGGNTAFVDDPNLTDRSDKPRRRPLVRIVLDNQLRISESSKLVQTAKETPTIVFTNSANDKKVDRLLSFGVEVIVSPMGGRDLAGVLQVLKLKNIQSVLVEGGSEIAGSFCDERLVDKVTFVMSPIIIGGREAPMAIAGSGAESLSGLMRLNHITVRHHDEDIEITGYPAVK